LTEELRQKQVDGARTLLDTLEAPQRIERRDIVTGNESWIDLHISPNSIWIGAEKTAPARPRTTMASTKAILTVFWGIRGVTLVDRSPQGASLNGADFDEHILQVIASELHAGEEKKHCPWPLVWTDNARPHTSEWNLARMEELRLKSVHHPPFSPDVASSDFFLFGWRKDGLSSRQVSEIHGLLRRRIQNFTSHGGRITRDYQIS
jgi:histone-lysine N-methyltransferase SETMAR